MTPLTPSQARHAYDLAHYGDASSDARLAALEDLRAAEEAVETIDQRCFRLGLRAAEKDAEAERHMAAAADAAGRAAGRRLRWGNDALVASFDREELACTTLAADAMAEAERLRSQCAALRRAQRYADDVVGMLEAAE